MSLSIFGFLVKIFCVRESNVTWWDICRCLQQRIQKFSSKVIYLFLELVKNKAVGPGYQPGPVKNRPRKRWSQTVVLRFAMNLMKTAITLRFPITSAYFTVLFLNIAIKRFALSYLCISWYIYSSYIFYWYGVSSLPQFQSKRQILWKCDKNV